MNNTINTRNGFIHLYNPKKEGLGSYDINYINATKNKNRRERLIGKKIVERYVA
tara:strand:- start:141 stop:302 length:162 start_codon:yes stop_codon:yes gene_type:complete